MVSALRAGFAEAADTFDLTSQLDDATHCARILLMVSRLDHCLTTCATDDAPGLSAVRSPSSCPTTRTARTSLTLRGRRVHIPVTIDSKPAAEEQLLQAINEQRIDLVMVAR